MMFPLFEIVSDAEEFCERMSFPVYDESVCYNGIPVASIRNLNKKTHWSEMFTWPSNKSPLDWSTMQILTFIFRHTPIFHNFLKMIGFIILIIIFGYFFNRYQMKLKEKAEDESEKIVKERMEQIRLRAIKKERILKKMKREIEKELRETK